MEKFEAKGFIVTTYVGQKGRSLLINAGHRDYSELDQWIRENYEVLKFKSTKDSDPKYPAILQYLVVA